MSKDAEESLEAQGRANTRFAPTEAMEGAAGAAVRANPVFVRFDQRQAFRPTEGYLTRLARALLPNPFMSFLRTSLLRTISTRMDPICGHVSARRGLEVAAVFALGIVGAFDFLVQPLGVGAAVRDLSLSQSQAGFFASFEMAGGMFSAVLALFWIRWLPWRSAAVVNLFLMAGGYLLSTRLDSLAALTPARILVGFAGGNLVAISLAWLADTSRPERFGGFFVALQTLAQILAFALLPATALRAGGLDGLFFFLALLAGLALTCTPCVPAHGRHGVPSTRLTAPVIPAALALFGISFFSLNTGAFWGYIERIGTAGGLSLEAIGGALAISGFMACAGSLTAARLGSKVSLRHALGATFLGQWLALGLLLTHFTTLRFTLALGLFGFFWNFAIPYQLGALVRNDPSGRRVVLVTAFQAAGLAAGPPLVAVLIDPVGLFAMHGVAATTGGVSLLLFLVLHRQQVSLRCRDPSLD